MPFASHIHLRTANLARTFTLPIAPEIPTVVSVINFQTTDATVMRMFTFAGSIQDFIARCTLQIGARRTDAIAFGYRTRQLDMRTILGVAAVDVTTPVVDNTAGVITATVTVSVAGNEVRVDVNGAAGQTIQWEGTATFTAA